MSPFFTPPPGVASLTAATMTSPTPALRRLLPPKTRIHKRLLAPELSATLSRVSFCITYSALDTILTSRHRLRADSGRVSTILTVSPTRAAFCSSCTTKRLECLTRFLYKWWGTSVSTETTAVFSGLSETTRPTRSLRVPRPVFSLCTGSACCTGPGSRSSTGPLLPALLSPRSSASRPSVASLLLSLSSVTLRVLLVFLVQDGQEPGDLLPNLLELSCVLQLSCSMLKTQVEKLPPRLGDASLELIDVQLAHLCYVHEPAPPRTKKRLFMGSFWAASIMASRASCSLTPLISNITRPGLTTAT